MKILITTDLYKPSVNGVVTSVINLTKGLEAKGHEVRILTLSPGHHSFVKDGVFYIGSVDTGRIYPGTHFRLRCPGSFKKELIAWHPDIVHSQCEFSTFSIARRIAEACNAPLIHTYHTVYEDYTHYFCPVKPLGRRLVAGFSRHVLNRADAVIAPSQKVADLLERYNVNTRVSVIPTGIDLHAFSGYSPAPNGTGLKLIFIGRLAKEKNIEELLRMTAACSDLPIELIIVGDGPEGPSLMKLSEELGLGNTVTFTGMVPPEKVNLYYRMGDVFVNASNSETQGLTYIEAMASGLPMLCRKDACLSGIVMDKYNGWQYENSAEFRAHLIELLDDRHLKKRLSEGSKAVSRRFSTEYFADSAEDLYLQCIRAKSVQTLSSQNAAAGIGVMSIN